MHSSEDIWINVHAVGDARPGLGTKSNMGHGFIPSWTRVEGILEDGGTNPGLSQPRVRLLCHPPYSNRLFAPVFYLHPLFIDSMVLKQVVKLNTGAEMPVLGFGASPIIVFFFSHNLVVLLLLSFIVCAAEEVFG